MSFSTATLTFPNPPKSKLCYTKMTSLMGPSSASNTVNIRRDVQDAFYRYKMPRLQSKIEGKGNGIKTVIPNMSDIGRALGRPPSYITKFFGAELGALSTCDEKASKYIVNGAHDATKLAELLDIFIKKFVLCPACDNPETVLSVSKKDGTVYRTCQACGHRSQVDMLHKLVSYIRANPPPKAPRKTQAKDSAEAAEGQVAGLARKEEQIEGMIVPEDFDDALGDVQARNGDVEEEWDDNAAAALRADELSGLSESVRQKLSLGGDLVDSLDQFGDWLEESKDGLSNDAIIAEINSRDIRADKATAVVVQVLLATDDFARAFKARLPLFQQLVTGEKEQKALLGSVERLVGVVVPTLLVKTAVILQLLYNSDLVEEEALFAWRDKISKRYVSKEVAVKVRKAAAPFFEWLENAQESDDEESDGEDEDDEE